MADSPQIIAFSGSAPEDERFDAMANLSKAYTNVLPGADMREIVESIRADYQEQALAKSLQNSVVVPFPSRHASKTGMQSVALDDWTINIQGDFWERPSALGFDSLRAMVEQTPVLSAVIMTRVRQIQRFARVSESDIALPGYEIRHVDRMHKVTTSEAETIKLLNRFVGACGWEFNPRRRKALRRDGFAQFMGKITRDSLVMDSVGIETEWKVNKAQGIDGFYAVDGGSIRLCTEQGYRGDDEIFALQVVGGVVRTAYTFEDLIYEPRNPRSDVRSCGYGLSETELLIRLVTGFLNALTLNAKGFDNNAIPKGILHLSGNYDQKDLDAFKRYWNATVKGVNNAWTLPVLVSKDQESKASFEKLGVEFDEMMFAKWMTFLTSIICAIYGMSPAEINFDSFTAGNTSALGGTDTAEKLAASKDSGLRPLLSYFENQFTDYLITDFGGDYVFRWTGLDVEDADKKHEIRKLILTVDEMRAEEGYEKHPEPKLGAAPLDPALIGPYMAILQAEQPEQAGDAGFEDDDADTPMEPMQKSHVSDYTKKDGTQVKAHEDSRKKKALKVPTGEVSGARSDVGIYTSKTLQQGQSHQLKIPFCGDSVTQHIIALADKADPDWRFDLGEYTLADVPVANLVATQPYETPETVKKYAGEHKKHGGKEWSPALAVHYKGKVYLFGGHHRASAAISNGAKSVKLKVFNLREEKQTGSDFRMLKSHIKGYSKLDGTYIADHEDKRSKKAVEYNATGKHRAIWVGSKKQYAVQHPDGTHLSYHATLADAKDAVAVHRKKLKGEANYKLKRDPGHGDVLAGASIMEWGKSWLWGREGKSGSVYDEPDDKAILESAKLVPSIPVMMYRAHPIGKAHGDLETWTIDKDLAQSLVDDSPENKLDATKWGVPMRELLAREIDPSEVMIDFGLLSEEQQKELEIEWDEAVVANGAMLEHMRSVRGLKKSFGLPDFDVSLEWWK